MATKKIWPIKDSLAHVVDYARIQQPRPNRCRMNGSFSTGKKIGGFRGLYLHYCYCLGIIPKHSNHKLLSPELREECRRLNAISRQIQLLCREKLDTVTDVQAFVDDRKSELGQLQAVRQKCYNRLRRCEDRAEISASRWTYYNTIGLWYALEPKEMERLFQEYLAGKQQKTA